MTQWIQITPDDLNDYLAGFQVKVLREKVLAEGQDDPLPEIIADVAGQIRLEIQGHPGNQLSQMAQALPPELKRHACALIIEAAQGRLPVLKLTADQIRATDNARRHLQRVARGEVPVSAPEDPEDTPSAQAGSSMEVARSRSNRITGERLRGL